MPEDIQNKIELILRERYPNRLEFLYNISSRTLATDIENNTFIKKTGALEISKYLESVFSVHDNNIAAELIAQFITNPFELDEGYIYVFGVESASDVKATIKHNELQTFYESLVANRPDFYTFSKFLWFKNHLNDEFRLLDHISFK